MNISRNFLLIGGLYLLVGISIGMYMGASQDHTLVPVHAHINLLGFTLMTVFGVVYHAFPAMAASTLGKLHFWLHEVGVLVLLAMLWMMIAGKIAEAAMFPVAPLAEAAIFVGIVCFVVNLYQHAK